MRPFDSLAFVAPHTLFQHVLVASLAATMLANIPLHELIFLDFSRKPRTVPLPHDVLLILFGYVQRGCVEQYDPVQRRLPYRDLLSCALVCRAWSEAVPLALYRDIRLPVDDVRVGFARMDTQPSNWPRLSQLFTALTKLKEVEPRVLNSVRSLQLDVRLEALVDKPKRSRSLSLLRDLGIRRSPSPDDDDDGLGPERQYCDYTGLAKLLSLLPALKSLSVICHTGNSATPDPAACGITSSDLPRALLNALAGLRRLSHFRLERTSGWQFASHDLAWEVMAACPSLSHVDIEPVGLGHHYSSPTPTDMRSRRRMPETLPAELQVLSLTFRGLPGEMNGLAAYSKTLHTVFLRLDCWESALFSGLEVVLPPTLKTLGITCTNTYVLGVDGVLAGVTRAVERLEVLETFFIQADMECGDRLIQALPESVRRLEFDCIGLFVYRSTLDAAVLRAGQLAGATVYVPWSASSEAREAAARQMRAQFEPLAAALKSKGQAVDMRVEGWRTRAFSFSSDDH